VDARPVIGKTEMKDRLIGMMGTLGLALVLIAVMPTADAFAFGGIGGGNNPCKGGCRESNAVASNCETPLINGCTGKKADGTACCPSPKVDGKCPCG